MVSLRIMLPDFTFFFLGGGGSYDVTLTSERKFSWCFLRVLCSCACGATMQCLERPTVASILEIHVLDPKRRK